MLRDYLIRPAAFPWAGFWNRTGDHPPPGNRPVEIVREAEIQLRSHSIVGYRIIDGFVRLVPRANPNLLPASELSTNPRSPERGSRHPFAVGHPDSGSSGPRISKSARSHEQTPGPAYLAQLPSAGRGLR